MGLTVKDRVRETSITTGTGTYTLDGAVTGFQAFSAVGANEYSPYVATDGVNWEVGIGRVLTGPARLERTTILASSNAGSAVDWGTGTRDIICTLPATYAFPQKLSKSVAGGAGSTTLTEAESLSGIIECTGALTGNRNLVVSDTARPYLIYNNTTGSFTLTVKTAAGTGVVIPQGSKALVYSDGTNVVSGVGGNRGSWSPVLSDGTNDATMDGSSVGEWEIIGGILFWSCLAVTTSLGSVSGPVRIKGLPRTARVTGVGVSGSGGNLNVTAGYNLTAVVLAGEDYFTIRVWDQAAGTTTLTGAEWSADGSATFSGWFFI